MSIISSLLNAGASIVKTTAKGTLVVTRVAVISTVTASAAVVAAVVGEEKIAARQLQEDPNIKAGLDACKASYAASREYARNKAAAIEAAATDFAARHK